MFESVMNDVRVGRSKSGLYWAVYLGSEVIYQHERHRDCVAFLDKATRGIKSWL